MYAPEVIEPISGRQLIIIRRGLRGLMCKLNIPGKKPLTVGLCMELPNVLESHLDDKNDSEGTFFSVLHDWSNAAFKAWPEYSGSELFPVPSMSADHTPEQAYMTCGGFGAQRWNPEHPYGAARIRLLKFMLARINADIKSLS